jgi:hypothetical protein
LVKEPIMPLNLKDDIGIIRKTPATTKLNLADDMEILTNNAPQNRQTLRDDLGIYGKNISEIKQAPQETILDKVKSFFRESPDRLVAHSQNIYALSKVTGLSLDTVSKNFEKLARNPEITGIKPDLSKEQFTTMALAPAIAVGAVTNPVGTIIGLGAYTALNKIIPTEKFIPSDVSDETRTTIELADFIVKGAIVGGIFKKAPGTIEKFTKAKLVEYNLPTTLNLSSEKVRDIFQTGKLTTPEQQSLFGSLGLTREQYRKSLTEGINIQIPAEKITKIVDKPYWAKIKSTIGIKPYEETRTSLAAKPKVAPSGLLTQLEAPVTPGVQPTVTTQELGKTLKYIAINGNQANRFIDVLKSQGGEGKITKVHQDGISEIEYTLPSKAINPAIQETQQNNLETSIPKIETTKQELSAYPQGGVSFAKAAPIPENIPKSSEEHVMEMPEMVKLASDLMGKTPVIKHLAKSYGLFKFGKGIALDSTIFKNPNFAGGVLAHEIGHLIDWLPDYTLARGNILGRVATLKKYLKSTIDELPLTTRKEITEELKNTTHYWNPFDEKANLSYTKYRYSSKELYAEAISLLLNQPEKLKGLAPKFHNSFWQLIDRKPEVKQSLLELQQFLKLGDKDKLEIRQKDIRGMFKKGEELFYQERNKYKLMQKDLLFKLRTELIDKNTAILDKIKELEKQGTKINPEDNPKYYLEEYNYIGGKIKNLLEEINRDVLEPVLKESLTQEDLGEYLFLNRVITERADIANPLGHNRKTAEKQLQHLSDKIGQDKFNKLKSAIERFQQINKQLIASAEQSDLIKPDIYKEIVTNPAYATFQVLDHLDDYVTPAIIHKVGTLKPIANPFVSTTLKMISTLRAIERNKTRKSVVEFLQKNFPAEIQVAQIRRFGKYKAEATPKEGFEIIQTREDGKFKAYHVDPYIAQSVNYQPSGNINAVISVFRFFNSGYFRPVYVNLNLGFQTYNLMRDFIRAWKLNPGTNFPQMLKRYSEAIPIARRRVWGDFPDPVIKEMQQNGMLSVTYNDLMRGADDKEETEIEHLLKRYDILQKQPQNLIVKGINFIEEVGNFIETLPKVSSYLSRKETGMNIKEIAHEVRVYSGSPDFLRKGSAYSAYNNLFLFSNAIKEGFRGDIEGAFTNPRTRSGFWWKTIKLNILPKIIMFLATLGYFGQKIKENFDKQTEYDKTNYITLPLGLTDNGKAVYMKIPHDETGRLLSAIFWKGLNVDKEKPLESLQQIGSLTGGQLPTVTPTLDLVSAWGQYLTGHKPYDIAQGRNITTDTEQLAGGWYSLKPMLKWTAGKLGAYAFVIKGAEDETTSEKIIRFAPIIQRFIRITDYGETQKTNEALRGKWQIRAIKRIEKRPQ